MTAADDRLGDARDLCRGLPLAEDDLGEALTNRAVMVDPGEAEVLERIGGQLSEGLALGIGRIEPAVADRLEQGAKGKRSRRGRIVCASHGVGLTRPGADP